MDAPAADDYRRALDQAAIVAVTDRRGRILSCNDLFCEISGYKREELIGQNHRIINSGYHDKAFFHEMYATISAGRVWKGTIRNRRRSGDLYWVDTTIVPSRGAGGRIQSYIAIRFDVTSHVAALQALEAAKEQAVRAASAKDQFLANMSHEVRTPLNGIIGLADALARSSMDAEQRDMVALITDSGGSLRRILDDILDVTKTEAGALEIVPRPFDLREEVLSAAELMKIKADEKGLRFEIDFAPSATGWFEADPARLRQILSNLLSNAIKFTDRGGVSVRISVHTETPGHMLIIDVEDTGIGFDQAQAEALFDRFVQADQRTARRYDGAGLGLSISRSLAELMGGTLSARSASGLGSTFQLKLPVARPNASAAPSAPKALRWEAGAAPRILVAEDHPVNQLVVTRLLEPLGAVVVMTCNGEEGLAKFKEGRFDLVLLDMQMPVMDGLETVLAIRAVEQAEGRAPTPVAMMTANTSPSHHAAALAAGADGFIAKPVSLEILVEGINQLLRIAKTAPASACRPQRGAC